MHRSVLIDGYLRSPVTLPQYRRGMPAPNKGRTFPAEIYSADEMLRFMAELGRGYAGDRDRALFGVMWRCGLRIAEDLSLELRDLDLEQRTLTVRHGKGDKRRVLGVDEQLAAALEVWLWRRRKLGVGPGRPLFCVISRPSIGKPIYSSVVREKMIDAGRRAGIEKRMAPHNLRHTYAVNMLREGKNILLIQQMLGHKDLATTYRYLNHLDPWELIQAMQGRVWPAEAVPPPAPSFVLAA